MGINVIAHIALLSGVSELHVRSVAHFEGEGETGRRRRRTSHRFCLQLPPPPLLGTLARSARFPLNPQKKGNLGQPGAAAAAAAADRSIDGWIPPLIPPFLLSILRLWL